MKKELKGSIIKLQRNTDKNKTILRCFIMISVNDYNYTSRKPRFQLAYKILSGFQFAIILCSVINVVSLLFTHHFHSFLGSLESVTVPLYKFYFSFSQDYLYLIESFVVIGIITFLSIMSLMECIGKTDQSIIIPTKYMVMNFIVVFILEFNTLRNDGELLEKACPNISAAVFGSAVYLISCFIVILLKIFETDDYFIEMRWHHHGEFSLWNYAVFAKKKRIVYMFEAAPALAAFYFYYHSYNSFSSKTIDLIELNCAYIFVAFVVILTFFGNMYSLKKYKKSQLEPDPPESYFKNYYLSQIISFVLFAISYFVVLLLFKQ